MRTPTLACTLALLLATGCGQSPDAPGGASAAADPVTLVWLHHSTGDAILDGGLRQALQQAGVEFHDINYGEAEVEGYVIGDLTDPWDFPNTFNDPARLQVILGWELPEGRTHDIVMFKSCFPASNIESDEMLEEYKGYYRSLLPTFRAHPDVLFVAMSTPPLVRGETTPENARRAREWSRWITTRYARDLPNVRVFDLFDALAVPEGRPGENTLEPRHAEGEWDSHPSREGAQAVTRRMVEAELFRPLSAGE